MAADNPFPASDATNAVEITESLGEWFVHVVENGAEQVVSSVMESFATAYAEGQRMRLGLGTEPDPPMGHATGG